mgnify:CR=1 FL=1
MSISKKAKYKFIASRKSARFFLVQALYEWQISQTDIFQIAQSLADKNYVWDDEEMDEKRKEGASGANSEYFHELLQYITIHSEELNGMIEPFLDRNINDVDPIEKAILWLGTYELKYQYDIPYRVVINESVELAKQFGAEGSHRYVNSILDKVGKTIDWRQAEK